MAAAAGMKDRRYFPGAARRRRRSGAARTLPHDPPNGAFPRVQRPRPNSRQPLPESVGLGPEEPETGGHEVGVERQGLFDSAPPHHEKAHLIHQARSGAGRKGRRSLLMESFSHPLDVERRNVARQVESRLTAQTPMQQGHRLHQHVVVGNQARTAAEGDIEPAPGEPVELVPAIGQGVDDRGVEEDHAFRNRAEMASSRNSSWRSDTGPPGGGSLLPEPTNRKSLEGALGRPGSPEGSRERVADHGRHGSLFLERTSPQHLVQRFVHTGSAASSRCHHSMPS